MLASYEGPSKRSMSIFFEELSRMAIELQNVTLEDKITFKKQTREILKELQYLKVTSCESNTFNVF